MAQGQTLHINIKGKEMLFLKLLALSVLLNIYGILNEENKLLRFLHINSIIFFLAGFLCLIHMGNNANESNAYFQGAFFLGAVFLFCISIIKIRNEWYLKKHVITAISFFSSIIIAYAIITNYLFFINKEQSGFVNPKFIKNDTPCSNNVFIYFAKKGNDFYYRCPKESASDLFIVLGNQLNFPLIPWPSYYEGKSTTIESALHTKEESQLHIEKNHAASVERHDE